MLQKVQLFICAKCMTCLHIFACAAGEHFAIPSEKTPQSDPHSMSSYRGRDTTKNRWLKTVPNCFQKMEVAQNCSKWFSKKWLSSRSVRPWIIRLLSLIIFLTVPGMIQVQTLRFIFSIVPVKELGVVKGLKRFVCFYKDTEVKIRWVKNILDPMLRCLLGFDVVEGCEIICRKHWLLKVMLERSWKYQHETFHVVHICWQCSPKLFFF